MDIIEYINTLPHYHKHVKQGHIVEVLEYKRQGVDCIDDGHFNGQMYIMSSNKYDTISISVQEHLAYLERGELIDATDDEVAKYLLLKSGH